MKSRTIQMPATLTLEVLREERPFEHVSRFELVRGVEFSEKLKTQVPPGVRLERDPVPRHPIAYRIDAGVLWHELERRFYRVGPCSLVVATPGQAVDPGGWLAAVCWRAAPNGSRYSPTFAEQWSKVKLLSRAEAFRALADEWPWAKVCEAFGPQTKSHLEEDHVLALYCGAGEAIEVEYDAIDDRSKASYLSGLVKGNLLGPWFTAEHLMSPRAEAIFRDGVGSRLLSAASKLDQLRDKWAALRPEAILEQTDRRRGKAAQEQET